MNRGPTRWYRAGDFAELSGLTVRTLHHYDRLGLLSPAGRSEAGYRLYSAKDLVRLQQVVTLKFLGFPLKEIKRLLDRNMNRLSEALAIQREIIEEKRRNLDRAVKAIAKVERALAADANGELDWDGFASIIEVIKMQTDMDWVKKYYTEEQRQTLADRADPEVIRKGERDWAALISEVEAALDEDPAGEKAQALAARWERLIQAFTMGDSGIESGLKKMYSDQGNWPKSFKKPYSDEVGAFICEALEIRKRNKRTAS